LQPGDVITVIGDATVPNYGAFVRAISRYYASKEPVAITYMRDGEEQTVLLDLTIDRMFTGLIEGTESGQEAERKRRQRIAGQRSASGSIWRSKEREEGRGSL